MYYPIQIPYILNKSFAESVKYTEEAIQHFQDFVICFWEMQPISVQMTDVNNVIRRSLYGLIPRGLPRL